jgi:hypothetical protein
MAETCHCGALRKPGRAHPGELCSLCHYAPLASADYAALPRKVRDIIRDLTSGTADVFDEGLLTDHGLIMSDDWRSVGKAADVWRKGKPVIGIDGKPVKPSSCESLTRAFVFGNERRRENRARAIPQVPRGLSSRSDSGMAAA